MFRTLLLQADTEAALIRMGEYVYSVVNKFLTFVLETQAQYFLHKQSFSLNILCVVAHIVHESMGNQSLVISTTCFGKCTCTLYE